ncbi:MAG: hypothetical protein AAGC68_00080 [Verrucomicrobiota bacterium]
MYLRSLPLLCFFALVLNSCERAAIPEGNESAANPVVEERAGQQIIPVANGGGEKDTETSNEPEVPDRSLAEEVAAEREQPLLRVFMEGDRVVVEGAIRSYLQHDRIISQLDEGLSEIGVEDRLEVDTNRWGVGWGNRVTEGFLIPYFLEVEEPFVEYEEGVVTLKGNSSSRLKRIYHELAITIFTGPHSRDLDNLIVTE